MRKRLTLTLTDPITIGSLTYDKLNLSSPTLGQLKQMETEVLPFAQLAKLISVNANVLPSVVDELSQEDAQACERFFASCLPQKPPNTPAASSPEPLGSTAGPPQTPTT